MKHFSFFFNIKIANNICPWCSIYLMFLIKKLFSTTLVRNISQKRFYILIILHDQQLYIWDLVILNLKVNIFTCIKINRIHYYSNYLLYCLKSIHNFFDTAVICLQILFFKISINLSAATDFSSLCAEYISILLSHDLFLLIYCKIHYPYLPIFLLVDILRT